MQKSSERLEIGRPVVVSADLFGNSDELVDDEDEVTQEDPTEEENGWDYFKR